jgi:hypothetical protein
VLAGVLAREGAETSATDTIRTTLDEAARLPALVAQYDHAFDVATKASAAATIRRVLTPALAEHVLADPAWPALARALGDLTGQGQDAGQVLAQAVGHRDLATAISVSQVLHHRINQQDRMPPSLSGSPLLWLPSPAAIPDPVWRRHLEERAAVIQPPARRPRPRGRRRPSSVGDVAGADALGA